MPRPPLTLTLSPEDGGRGDKAAPSKTGDDRAAEKALNLIKLRKDRIAAHDKVEAAKLAGDWKVTMPKGFVFSARIQQMPDGLLQLSNARAFNGIYTLKDQRLEYIATSMDRDRKLVEQIEGKIDDPREVASRFDRTRDFVWKLQADGSLLLVEEDHSSGAKYIGATLQKTEKSLSEPNWADRMFSELRLDFGKVERGAKLTHVIQITNPFRETITIGDITLSRGPFTVMIDRRELRAAEAAEMVITVEPELWVNKQSRKVSVPIAYKDRDGKEVSQIVQIELHVEIASNENKDPAANQNGALLLLPVEKLIAETTIQELKLEQPESNPKRTINKPFVAIRGLVPFKKQIEECARVSGKTFDTTNRDWKALDFVIERKASDEADPPWDRITWRPLPIQDTIYVLEAVANYEADVVAASLTNPVFTCPILSVVTTSPRFEKSTWIKLINHSDLVAPREKECPDHLLFRHFDFSIEASKSYLYRTRIQFQYTDTNDRNVVEWTPFSQPTSVVQVVANEPNPRAQTEPKAK